MIMPLLLLAAIFLIPAWLQKEEISLAPNESNRKHYIVFICVLLGLQSGLRGISVGADTAQYYNRFLMIESTSFSFIWEDLIGRFWENSNDFKDPGYNLFTKVFQLFSEDYQLFLLVVALIFFSSLGYFIYKNTHYMKDATFAFLLYLLIFYSFFSITGIRQTLATAVWMWCFELAKRKKLILFLLLWIVAYMFHNSAVAVLPAFWIMNYRRPRFLLSMSLGAFPVIMLLRVPFANVLGSIAGYESDELDTGGAYVFILFCLVAAIVVWARISQTLKMYPEDARLVDLFAVAVIFLPLLWVHPMYMRVVQYYSIFLMVLFSDVFQTLSGSKNTMDEIGHQRRIGAMNFQYIVLFAFMALYYFHKSMNYHYVFFWKDQY